MTDFRVAKHLLEKRFYKIVSSTNNIHQGNQVAAFKAKSKSFGLQ